MTTTLSRLTTALSFAGLLLASGCVVHTGPAYGGQQTTFQVSNESAESICYVHISPTEDTSWGPDQLGPQETIPPGTTRDWELYVGAYDFQFLDCNRVTMMERRGVEVSASGLSVTYRVRE